MSSDSAINVAKAIAYYYSRGDQFAWQSTLSDALADQNIGPELDVHLKRFMGDTFSELIVFAALEAGRVVIESEDENEPFYLGEPFFIPVTMLEASVADLVTSADKRLLLTETLIQSELIDKKAKVDFLPFAVTGDQLARLSLQDIYDMSYAAGSALTNGNLDNETITRLRALLDVQTGDGVTGSTVGEHDRVSRIIVGFRVKQDDEYKAAPNDFIDAALTSSDEWDDRVDRWCDLFDKLPLNGNMERTFLYPVDLKSAIAQYAVFHIEETLIHEAMCYVTNEVGADETISIVKEGEEVTVSGIFDGNPVGPIVFPRLVVEANEVAFQHWLEEAFEDANFTNEPLPLAPSLSTRN